MNVLMFGWEFPPYITGGLGTACYGLSQSLSRLVSRITFVLPKVKGSVDAGSVDVVGANAVPGLLKKTASSAGSHYESHEDDSESEERIETYTIDSGLRPYLNDTQYHQHITRILRQRAARRADMSAAAGPLDDEGLEEAASLLETAGDYGGDLLAEVTRYAYVASRIVRTAKYDVIHAHDWMTYMAGVEAKKASGLPLVCHIHATEFDRCGENIDQRIYDIERYGMEQADKVIAVSQRTKDMVVARYGIPEEKVAVVHNGVVPKPHDAARGRKALPEKLVVFLGRITMQKGPEYFLEAAYLVAQKLPGVRFVMAGSGDMLPKMVDRMAELRLLDRFHFTGFVGEDRRNILLSMADCFVMTSISEPFGITPVEAIQHDVPVIVTKQCGVAEILRSAVKVDFWDVRRIADAIIKVLTEDGLAREIVRGARRELEDITWDRAAARVNDIYREFV